MRFKKIAAAVLAAVMLGTSAMTAAVAEDDLTVVAAASELAAPQNVRYEDGDIKWDSVEDAEGYYMYWYDAEGEVITYERFTFADEEELAVEFDRYCYENRLDLGAYTVRISALDKSWNEGALSEAVTAEYAATLSAPTNLGLDDGGYYFEWDKVDGAYLYNVRVCRDVEDKYSYLHYYGRSSAYFYLYNLSEGVEYYISVQAMDKEYNVSEWTEPFLVEVPEREESDQIFVEAPQNVRFDESGENIIWDPVDGASEYLVVIGGKATINQSGVSTWIYSYEYPEEAFLENWKSYVTPYVDGEVTIYVYAFSETWDQSDSSEYLYADFEGVKDESITVPGVKVDDYGRLTVDVDDDTDIKYSLYFLDDGIESLIENYYTGWNDGIAVEGLYLAGTYEAVLYVMDENNHYNCATYEITVETKHDESVWVPVPKFKFDNLSWDFDQVRHDDTVNFWVRVTDVKNGTVVALEERYNGRYYGISDLPNGSYTVEVCACVEWYDEEIYAYRYSLGAWSKPLNIDVFDGNYFDEENEFTEEVQPDKTGGAVTIPAEDRILNITVNPATNMTNKDGEELDLAEIELIATEIFSEDGLDRAKAALKNVLKKDMHFNMLDLTLLYKGEDFSNGYDGLVQVIIPLPEGHKNKDFSFYRIELDEESGEYVSTKITGEQTEDSYIVYLEHFSEYVLVADGGETVPLDPDPTESEPTESEPVDSEPSNPNTGIAIAIIPVALAASVVIATYKKRK